MTNWTIAPSKLSGMVQIPTSKSQSIRALLFALLAKGRSVVKNLLLSPDVSAMLLACKHLGASIEQREDYVSIEGVGGAICGAEDVIQAGNSGLILRLVGALAGLSPKPVVITGDNTIRHVRPVSPLLDALSQLGVQALSARGDGGAPIIVRGPLFSGSATFLGEDSQPVSGMLIASAFAPGPIDLFVVHPGEKPWVNLTLTWLLKLGIPFIARKFEHYSLPGNASIEGFRYTVPVDFSSLTYPLAAAVLTDSEIHVENLDFDDPQGDKKVIGYLQEMGATIELDPVKGMLQVRKCRGLQGISLDANDCIDAVPLLAVLGCFAEGKTEIRGVSIARKKESDRISCIAQELRKMGASIEEHPDGLTLYRSSLKGAEVQSFQDHRMALSLAIAALAAKGKTHIKDVACADKSFPSFCQQMRSIGAQISIG
jgi:3-phosphoshikimate 1-carboxyvinyltransferase